MTLVLKKAREYGVMTLIFANDVAFAKPRVAEGWGIVAVGTDIGWFSEAAAATRAAVESKS
jgi:4-hydroxy-2-oxoheptanedioate aldolase